MRLFADTVTDRTESPPRRVRLTERDAVELWIARWLRIQRKDLIRRYNCDPRRIYEIWQGKKFPASRERAMAEFRARHPEFGERIDFGNHRVIPRTAARDDQLVLFDD